MMSRAELKATEETGLLRGGREGTHHVTPAAGGKVVRTGFQEKGAGNYVVIDIGGGQETKYFHLQDVHAENGQYLTRGEVLGTAGNTGASRGAHLHTEYWDMTGNYTHVNDWLLEPYPQK